MGQAHRRERTTVERTGHVIIAGRKTLLRPVKEEDLPAIRAWDEDPEIVKLVGKKFIEQDALIKQGLSWQKRTRIAMAVLDAQSKRLIGNLELENISWRSRSAEMRVCIGEKEYWGKGFGTDAISSFTAHVFENTGLRQVYLRVYRTNRRAIACYRKCGFRVEAILRAGSRAEEGHEDLLLMSLYKPERAAEAENIAASSRFGYNDE